MRYVLARYQQYQRDYAYRIYITDALKFIAENSAKNGMRGGNYPSKRWYDLINAEKIDDKTADEIIADVSERAGLEVI